MDTKGIVALIARIRERANLVIEDELNARGIEGIVPAHGSVLAFLFRQDAPVPIKAVVEDVGRVKSTVTEMLNTLERHGYIRKTPCETDNRVTYVTLTKKGRAFRKDFDAISDKLLTTVYGPMPTRDRRALMRLLSQVEQNLKAAEGGD
jgi:DNA-binding MarR family transcriptional regulator